MTTPKGQQPTSAGGPQARPGRTAVRITGDHYQWLHAWTGCLRMLHDAETRADNPIVEVGVEVDRVGNVDDIVLFRLRPPHSWAQVKYAVDAASPIGTAWLTAPSPAGGASVLAKLVAAHAGLREAGEPFELAIVTNRVADPGDVLLTGRDNRTRLLLPRAAEDGPKSDRGQLRSQWANHAGIDETQLLELLSVLRFDLGQDIGPVSDTAGLLMLLTGLRSDSVAVRSGADWVAQQVQAGRRRLDLPAVLDAVTQRELRAGPVWTNMSVATLTPDPLRDDAAVALDWVDRFAGDDAWSKRTPAPPASWQQLQADIEAIPGRLRCASRVAVTGSLRQATAFTVGAVLRMVTGIDVAVAQRGELWASTVGAGAASAPALAEHAVGQGDELAVAVEVATPITDDVLAYLRRSGLSVGRLVVLSPPTGVGDRSVPDAGAANALAVGIRNTVRSHARSAPRVHLFLAGPMGLALLLGHRWNRVRPTTVYEDNGTDYEPAFTVSA